MIFGVVIANILGISFFLYLYWKRLKEDYPAEKIFDSGFIILFGIFLGIVISKIYPNIYWYWIIILNILIFEAFNIFKLKIKLFESLDTLVISLLPWLSLFYLSYSIKNSDLLSFLAFWVCLLLIFLFFLFNNFYRTFNWYKSGKVGFSGLAVAGIFFGIRSIFSLFTKNLISFAGDYEPYISGTFFVIAFLLLFRLSRIKK
ncbi:MAG TPA: hypothetical protein VI795_00735 [Patescibacteria group bacterium]|nr:hypothetical protein [Patescibacteria group bacterium]